MQLNLLVAVAAFRDDDPLVAVTELHRLSFKILLILLLYGSPVSDECLTSPRMTRNARLRGPRLCRTSWSSTYQLDLVLIRDSVTQEDEEEPSAGAGLKRVTETKVWGRF